MKETLEFLTQIQPPRNYKNRDSLNTHHETRFIIGTQYDTFK